MLNQSAFLAISSSTIANKARIEKGYRTCIQDVYNGFEDLDDWKDEELVIINRNAEKMSPEKKKKLLDMARIMFKEEV